MFWRVIKLVLTLFRDFIICARTDAKGVEGIEATIKRSKAYIDAGADMIFPEGLESLDGTPIFI